MQERIARILVTELVHVALDIHVSQILICNDLIPEFTLLCIETQCVLNLLEIHGPSKSREDYIVFCSELYQDFHSTRKKKKYGLET